MAFCFDWATRGSWTSETGVIFSSRLFSPPNFSFICFFCPYSRLPIASLVIQKRQGKGTTTKGMAERMIHMSESGQRSSLIWGEEEEFSRAKTTWEHWSTGVRRRVDRVRLDDESRRWRHRGRLASCRSLGDRGPALNGDRCVPMIRVGTNAHRSR